MLKPMRLEDLKDMDLDDEILEDIIKKMQKQVEKNKSV